MAWHQLIGLISGFLLALAISIRLEAYCVRLAGKLVGEVVSEKASLWITVLKVIYGVCLGYLVGFMLVRDWKTAATIVTITGACLTPILYKWVMQPSASWPQAVVMALVVPVTYTVLALGLLGGTLWSMSILLGVIDG